MYTKIVVELPLVIGVLADLAGDHPAVPRTPWKERAFARVDRDNFGGFFRSIGPGLNLDLADRIRATGAGTLSIALRLQDINDFTPMGIARQIPELKPLLRERQAWASAQNPFESDDPGSSPDPDRSRGAERMAEVDRVISAQVAEVIIHPAFQRLEAAWRGLHYLVTQSETGETLKIKVLDVATQELADDLAGAVEFERSLIFQKVYDDVYGRFRGEPFGLLVGDYEFSRRPEDIALLGKIAKVAVASFAPFIAAASARLLGLDRWGEIDEPRDFERTLATDAYAEWRSFRLSPDARFIALTMPRVLARPAYGQAGYMGRDSAAAPEFRFDASALGPGRDSALWISAAWFYAQRVADSFARYDFPTETRGIHGGGLVEEWPALVRLSSLESVTPVEVLLTDQRVADLSDLGLMPLVALRGTMTAVFFDNPSCARPRIDESPEASALAAASVQLPYILTISRFIHYFRAIARDRFGRAATSPEDIATELNSWVQRYVSPRVPSAEWRTRYLPTDVRVEVVPDPGRPGSQRAIVRLWLRDASAGSPSSLEEVVDLPAWALLRPYYQLENLAVSLRSVVDLPPKGADLPRGPAHIEARGYAGGEQSLQAKLYRIRPPRCHLTYEVELEANNLPETRLSLLARVRDLGDRRDWEELFNRYGPMIRAWCRSEFPGQEDDVVQEVFAKLVSDLKSFNDPDEDSFRRWLEALTHRVMADLKRTAWPRARGAQDRLDTLEASQDTYERPLEEEWRLELRLRLLRMAKERVRARVDPVKWSAYVETVERGRKPAEVAREFGRTVRWVELVRFLVIAELRREIGNLDGPDDKTRTSAKPETVKVRPKKPGAAIGRRPKRTPRAKSDRSPRGLESHQGQNPDAPGQELLREPTAGSTLRRHTDISFPDRVRVGQWSCLRVQLVPALIVLPGGEVREQPKPHPHDTTLALLAPPHTPEAPPPPVRLTVSVVAENFEIRGPYRVEILVPREGPSPAAHFDLCGQDVGPGRIMIDFAQEGRPVGSVDLRPEVVPEVVVETSGAGRAVDPVVLDLGGDREPAPDLVLKVFEHRLAGPPGRLHFVLSSSHPALVDLPVFDGDLGTLDLRADVAAWVEAQFQALRHLAERPDATADEVTRVLADVGWKLYDQILPPALQDLCWTFRGRGVRSLLILSDDPHIPWELVKPFRSDPVTGAIVAEEDHWGASFAMTHWLRGRPPVSRLSLRRVIAVGTGPSKPPAAMTAPEAGPPEGEAGADAPASAPAHPTGLSPGTTRDMVARPAASAPIPIIPASAADLGDGEPLSWLEEELALLRALEVSGSEVRRVPALLGAVCRAIEDGDFHLLHLAGHGAFGGTGTADASAVLLEDGPMRVADLSPRMAASLRREHPLIVFNTCCSGRLGFSLTRLGAWGAQFVQLGCGGFLGTLWPVTDRAAASFARAFYESLARGLPLGEAVRLARIQVRGQYPQDPTWLAYCCYADPMARVGCLPASTTASPGRS
jgi:type VI secretion system protein ImpC